MKSRIQLLPILVVVFLVSGYPGLSQEEMLIDRWRSTLSFGIDSEVIDLLDQLESQGEERLDVEIVERFRESSNNTLRVATIEFFQKRDDPVLGDDVRELILSEDSLGDELLRIAVTYLADVVADPTPELLGRYAEMAEDSNLLAAGIAIRAIGAHPSEAAVGTLLDLYDEVGSDDLRGSVIRALGEAGSDEALPLLTSVVSDEFQLGSLRQYGAEALGQIGAPESFDLLDSLSRSDDALLRAYAIHAIGYYESEIAARRLTAGLRDSFWRVRVAALQGLAERAWTEALEAVAYKATHDPERPVRLEAIKTLGVFANAASAEVLGEIAESVRSSESERIEAIGILYETDLSNQIERFARIIADEWERENSRILDAVGKHASQSDNPAGEPLLRKFLEHPNFIIRIYGIRGIGRLGLETYIPELKQIADASPAGLMQNSALAALERMEVFYTPASTGDVNGPESDASAADIPETENTALPETTDDSAPADIPNDGTNQPESAAVGEGDEPVDGEDGNPSDSW